MSRSCAGLRASRATALRAWGLAGVLGAGAGILGAVGLPAPVVHAQAADEEADPPEYPAIIDGALAEFQAGRWVEARALFQRAHTLFPNARTLRGVGMASFEMADYPAAIEALEGALASDVRPLTEDQREQTSALLSRARALIGHYSVPAAASDVRLTVDGVVVEPSGGWPASEGRIVLGVGTHEIVMRDADGRTSRVRVAVRGGEDAALALTPPGGEVASGGSGSGGSSDPTPWVVAGVGAAVAIGGAILYGVGASDIGSVNASVAGTPWSSVSGVYDSAPVLTGTGIAALVAGGAAVVIGVGWGVSAELGSDDDGRHATLRVRPGGLSLEGTF